MISDDTLRGLERHREPKIRAMARAFGVQREELCLIQREAKRLRKSKATDEELRHGLRVIQSMAKEARLESLTEA